MLLLNHAVESFAVLLQRYYYKEENWAHSKVSRTIVSQLQCITAKSRPASIEHLPRWSVRNRFQPILFTADVLSFFRTEKSPSPSSPASPFMTTKRVLSIVDPLLQGKSPLPVLNDCVHQAVKVDLEEAGRPKPMACLARPQPSLYFFRPPIQTNWATTTTANSSRCMSCLSPQHYFRVWVRWNKWKIKTAASALWCPC